MREEEEEDTCPLVHLDSPGLQVLDPAQHIQVTSRVLLDHILHVVRPQGLFEPFLVQEKLHDPARGRTLPA